jgi:putative phosphoesterase
MLLAVISDTHGHVEYTRHAVTVLEPLNVDRIIHCGDIGSPAIPPLLARWPVDYVVGNVDRDIDLLRRTIELVPASNPSRSHRLHGRFGSLELEGKKIAFLHSDDERLFRETTSSGQWDLVCYGHTHKPEMHFEGRTLVLNPGALFRALKHTLAVVALPQLEASHLTVWPR